MDYRQSSIISPTFLLALITFLTAMVGLAVDLPQLLGGTIPPFETYGNYILAILALLGGLMLIYHLISQLSKYCLNHWIRLRRARRRILQFIDTYDGDPINANVDTQKVHLLQQYLKVRHLHCRVTNITVEPSKIIISVDKGSEDSLCFGMQLAIYHTNQAEPIGSTNLVSVRPTDTTQAHAILGLNTVRIVVPNSHPWSDIVNEQEPSLYDIRPFGAPEDSPINTLLSRLVYDIDDQWTWRDLVSWRI